MAARTLFTNSPYRKGDFAINFFMLNAKGATSAQLACPFFTTTEPLELLRQAGCKTIQLLVRLCGATTPAALVAARGMKDVHVRYFTSEAFHAKFYLVGNSAMIGSANLTNAGLKSNREIALAIDSADEVFDEIPALFDDLWDSAAVLTDTVMDRFTRWHRSPANPRQDDTVEGVEPCSPTTVNVATHKTTRERTYLEAFRREYYETLLPAHAEVRTLYEQNGARHPAFADLPSEYEIDRFLNWAKLEFTTDETLQTFPLRNGEDRRAHILAHIRQWLGTAVEIDPIRTGRLQRLKAIFASRETLERAAYQEVTDALLGCAAFDEQMRFTKGGELALALAFQKDNDLNRVRKAFRYLAFDGTEFVRKTYDCIFSPEYKLAHFGRTSVLELFGWVNNTQVPPINGRTIKALRYFGFDVRT